MTTTVGGQLVGHIMKKLEDTRVAMGHKGKKFNPSGLQAWMSANADVICAKADWREAVRRSYS